MESLDQRLNLSWYQKRISQNTAIKNFLVAKIQEHQSDIGYSKEELLYLNYEDLLEIAIACVNKKISVVLGAGKDFCNEMDAKFSIARINSRGQRYSAGFKCKLKKGLYSVVYENNHDKFYFFVLPAGYMQEIDIPFTLDGRPKRTNKWWAYEVDTFEEMCLMINPVARTCNEFNNLFEEVA